MLFTQWLNELTDRVRRKRTSKFARKARKVSRNAPTSSEVLESRVVPTITVDLAVGGVLTITGDAAANRVTISVDANVYTIDGGTENVEIGTNDPMATAADLGNRVTIGAVAGDITSIVVSLGDGGDKLTVASFDDAITSADGGDDSGDTIQGPDAGATWTIGATNTLDLDADPLTVNDVVTFSGFRVAQGGSGVDEFDITAAATLQLKGGAGNDVFDLGAALTGSVSGEDGIDVLTGTEVDNVTLASFSASGLGVAGNEGGVSGISGGFSGINTLTANNGTLTGIGVNSRWTLDGTAPTYATVVNGVVSNPMLITGFTSLHGGSAVDTFNVTGNNTFDLDGGAGNDVINIGVRTVDPVTKVVTTTSGQLIGTANGGAGNDTLDAQSSDRAVVLDGGDGNDVVIGSTQDDELTGGLGADRLYGLAGDDTMSGGAGNDVLDGGADTDRVLEHGIVVVVLGVPVEQGISSAIVTNTKMTGGQGTDGLTGVEEMDLLGNSGNNLLDASAFTLGSVTLNGGDGSDTLAGGSGGDVLNGKGGPVLEDAVVDTDVLRASVAGTVSLVDAGLSSSSVLDTISNFQAASLTGSAGDDIIDASTFNGAVTINGGAGNDSIEGGLGNNSLNGMNGNDTVSGQGGNDSILGGAGNDLLDGGGGNDRVNGNDGDDTITGGIGDDTITGDGGKDSINGEDGNDKIDGGTGNDTVLGGANDDSISGGAGLDSIEGNAGNDTLNGNADNDRIEAGDGDDQVFGGAGNDVMLGGLGNDEINSQGGNDTMLGEAGDDKLNGGAGNELMFGGDGNDAMNGMAGNDTMLGDDGDDTMLGGAGNDLILGGKGGDDYINGQSGKDSVSGGGDQDTIVDGSKERIDNFPHNDQDDVPDSHDEFYDLFDPTLFADMP